MDALARMCLPPGSTRGSRRCVDWRMIGKVLETKGIVDLMGKFVSVLQAHLSHELVLG